MDVLLTYAHYFLGLHDILFQLQHCNMPMFNSHTAGHAISSKSALLKHVLLQLLLLDTRGKRARFLFFMANLQEKLGHFLSLFIVMFNVYPLGSVNALMYMLHTFWIEKKGGPIELLRFP